MNKTGWRMRSSIRIRLLTGAKFTACRPAVFAGRSGGWQFIGLRLLEALGGRMVWPELGLWGSAAASLYGRCPIKCMGVAVVTRAFPLLNLVALVCLAGCAEYLRQWRLSRRLQAA